MKGEDIQGRVSGPVMVGPPICGLRDSLLPSGRVALDAGNLRFDTVQDALDYSGQLTEHSNRWLSREWRSFFKDHI
jgi:hypothetical protein